MLIFRIYLDEKERNDVTVFENRNAVCDLPFRLFYRVMVEPLDRIGSCRCGFGHGVCPWLLERPDVRNVIMKKLWLEEILGVKLHWWQLVVLRSMDHELRKRYDTILRHRVRFSPPTVEELELRDKFFQQLHEELSCKMDGTDLVAEIPDIDLEE